MSENDTDDEPEEQNEEGGRPEEPSGEEEPAAREPDAAGASNAEESTAGDGGSAGGIVSRGGRDAREYLLKGALVLLALLAVIATVRFYLSASTAIDVWVAREYRALFQAAFNLVVLLASAIGVSFVVRELAA